MKHLNKVALVLFAIILMGCEEKVQKHDIVVSQQNLEKIWRLTEIEISDDFYNSANALEQRKIQGQIGQGYLLSLFPNGEVTRLIDNDMSVYQMHYFAKTDTSPSRLILENKSEKDTFSNLHIEEVKGFTFLTCDYKNIGRYKFHLVHDMLEDFKKDPYYSENNKWRIKSKKYESQKELKARIFNYLNHCKALLLSSTQRPNTKIRLMNSKGILKLFDGGVGLLAKEQVTTKWVHRFYSDSQASEVYDRLAQHFEERIIKKKTPAGWRLDDVSVIDSLISVY